MKKLIISFACIVILKHNYAQPGGVGINTDNPQATLHVHGNGKFDSIPQVPIMDYIGGYDMDGFMLKINTPTLKKELFDLMCLCFDDGFGSSGREWVRQSYSDEPSMIITTNTPAIYFQKEGVYARTVNLSSLFTEIQSSVLYKGYLYVLGKKNSPLSYLLLRFNANDITQPYISMTFNGQSLGIVGSDVMMNIENDQFYFSFDAGNLAANNRIASYSLSGTTLSYLGSVTCGTSQSMNRFFIINGNYYGFNTSTATLRKFDSFGNQVYETANFSINSVMRMFQLNGAILVNSGSSRCLHRIYY